MITRRAPSTAAVLAIVCLSPAVALAQTTTPPALDPGAHEVAALLVEPTRGPFPVAPTRDAIFDHNKSDAAFAGTAGHAILKCTLAGNGALSNCTQDGASPSSYGDAALKLAAEGLISAQARIVDGAPVPSELVLVLVSFQSATAPSK